MYDYTAFSLKLTTWSQALIARQAPTKKKIDDRYRLMRAPRLQLDLGFVGLDPLLKGQQLWVQLL